LTRSKHERVACVCRVTVTTPATYPGYPDPSKPTGWADVPAMVRAADLGGREDIEYTAMTTRAIICVDHSELMIMAPEDGMRLWLLGLHFDNGLPDLDLVGLADSVAIEAFALADVLLVTTDTRLRQGQRCASRRSHPHLERSAQVGQLPAVSPGVALDLQERLSRACAAGRRQP
jgi:hypothetical protein